MIVNMRDAATAVLYDHFEALATACHAVREVKGDDSPALDFLEEDMVNVLGHILPRLSTAAILAGIRELAEGNMTLREDSREADLLVIILDEHVRELERRFPTRAASEAADGKHTANEGGGSVLHPECREAWYAHVVARYNVLGTFEHVLASALYDALEDAGEES